MGAKNSWGDEGSVVHGVKRKPITDVRGRSKVRACGQGVRDEDP